MKTYYKDPDAVLDYSFDWSNWLADDSIDTSSWSVPSGVVKVSSSNSGSLTTVWLSGGKAGESYLITNHIVTSAGREDDRSFLLELKEL